MADLLLIGFAGLVFALGIVLLVDFFAPRPSWDETEAWERARRATGGTDGDLRADGVLFKSTRAGRRPTHADSDFVWPAPRGRQPGAWTPPLTGIVACKHGYHLATAPQLLDWLSDEVWVAEGRGERLDHGDKVVFGQARLLGRTAWDARSARLFAADCAERVLPIFEAAHPGDDRPRLAIQAARDYANGLIGDAARAAARAAAWAAAWDAAGDAAGDAAWAAAWDAAGDAAGDAAWVAAGDAARAAARAAAWAAAWDAAGDAAGDAAWTAEREWQTVRLLDYLTGEAP